MRQNIQRAVPKTGTIRD